MSWVGRVFKSSPSSGDGGKRSNRKKKRLPGKKNDSSSTADSASATSGGIKSFLSSLIPGGSSKKNSKKKYNRVSEESHELRAINHNNSSLSSAGYTPDLELDDPPGFLEYYWHKFTYSIMKFARFIKLASHRDYFQNAMDHHGMLIRKLKHEYTILRQQLIDNQVPDRQVAMRNLQTIAVYVKKLGQIVEYCRQYIEHIDQTRLNNEMGNLMDRAHSVLQMTGVSPTNPEQMVNDLDTMMADLSDFKTGTNELWSTLDQGNEETSDKDRIPEYVKDADRNDLESFLMAADKMVGLKSASEAPQPVVRFSMASATPVTPVPPVAVATPVVSSAPKLTQQRQQQQVSVAAVPDTSAPKKTPKFINQRMNVVQPPNAAPPSSPLKTNMSLMSKKTQYQQLPSEDPEIVPEHEGIIREAV